MSQAQQAGYEARVANQNARLESERANDALERGRTEKRRYQQEAGQQAGRQRAAIGANNIDLSFGSAFDVRADTLQAGAEDVATIDRNTLRETRGFEINAMNFRSEAMSARRRRTAAYISGGLQIASTALGAATQYKRMSYGRGG